MTRAKAVATVRRILTDNAYANARFGTDLSLVTIDTATAEALVRPMGVLESEAKRAGGTESGTEGEATAIASTLGELGEPRGLAASSSSERGALAPTAATDEP
jgi:hypothetical protein